MEDALRVELAPLDDLVGISSLAEGADQIFAGLVLARGGRLNVVLPAADYRENFAASDAEHFDDLLAQAASVVELPFGRSTEEAFFAAGQAIVDRCELLLAVWDGQQARGLGGTGDVVAYAQAQGVNCRVIWPVGATRRSAPENP